MSVDLIPCHPRWLDLVCQLRLREARLRMTLRDARSCCPMAAHSDASGPQPSVFFAEPDNFSHNGYGRA